MHKLKNKQLGTLAVILVVLIVVVSLVAFALTGNGTAQKSDLPQAAPSQAVVQELQNNPAFQDLVSYTNTGFQPVMLDVKKGDTVRFTNNSSGELWITAIGTPANPVYSGSSSCGGSSFDSCGPMSPDSFWQFTFTQSGTYHFQNQLNPSQSGTITVTQ